MFNVHFVSLKMFFSFSKSFYFLFSSCLLHHNFLNMMWHLLVNYRDSAKEGLRIFIYQGKAHKGLVAIVTKYLLVYIKFLRKELCSS